MAIIIRIEVILHIIFHQANHKLNDIQPLKLDLISAFHLHIPKVYDFDSLADKLDALIAIFIICWSIQKEVIVSLIQRQILDISFRYHRFYDSFIYLRLMLTRKSEKREQNLKIYQHLRFQEERIQ